MAENIARALLIEGENVRRRVDLIVAGQRVDLMDVDQFLIAVVAVIGGDLKIVPPPPPPPPPAPPPPYRSGSWCGTESIACGVW